MVWHRGNREASAFTPSTIEEAASALHKNLVLGGASEEEVAGLLEAAASGAEAYWRWWLDYERERAKREHVEPVQFAIIYAHLGEKDEAFEWLEKAFEERENISGLKVDPDFDPPVHKSHLNHESPTLLPH